MPLKDPLARKVAAAARQKMRNARLKAERGEAWADLMKRKAEASARWRAREPDRARQLAKESRSRHKVQRAKDNQEWYRKNKTKAAAASRRHFVGNKDAIQARRRARYANDLQFRLAYQLRNRLCAALRGKLKVGSAVANLGCSIDSLKDHLAAQFAPGMSWVNWGQWHIDHVKPLSKFDLTDREQLLRACHYTNLQPLWAADNISKKNRLKENV